MNFKDIVAANINDLNEGEMKSFDIAEDQKILLVKINGKIPRYRAVFAPITEPRSMKVF